jgi:sulfite reductase alpha subunit
MRGKYGPMLAKVVVPFMKAEPPDYKEVFDFIEKLMEVYDEHARKKERVGDFHAAHRYQRVFPPAGRAGFGPAFFKQPRTNLFYHWEPSEEIKTNATRAQECQPQHVKL